MNHKRKNKRGHVRRKYTGGYSQSWVKYEYEEKVKTKKTFLQAVQASQNGWVYPLEDERP